MAEPGAQNLETLSLPRVEPVELSRDEKVAKLGDMRNEFKKLTDMSEEDLATMLEEFLKKYPYLRNAKYPQIDRPLVMCFDPYIPNPEVPLGDRGVTNIPEKPDVVKPVVELKKDKF